MSKYDPLWAHVQTAGEPALKLSFAEIREILGFEIDHSLLIYKKELAPYGYEVQKISLQGKRRCFSKKLG